MAKNGPIILIDDDKDECEILDDTFKQQSIENGLIYFSSGADALQYLCTTTDRPLLILCDINMPVMNGIEVRKRINEDDYLRKKSIPFIFYTTSATQQAINTAYELNVQGFFEKEHTADNISRLIKSLYDYWQLCRHPNC